MKKLLTTLLLTLTLNSFADEVVVTSKGERVLLKDDFTWEKQENEKQPGYYLSVLGATNTAGNSCQMLFAITNYESKDLETLQLFINLFSHGGYQGESLLNFSDLTTGMTRRSSAVWLSKPCDQAVNIDVSRVNSCKGTDGKYYDNCLNEVYSASPKLTNSILNQILHKK